MIIYYDLTSGEQISEREIRFRASPVAPKAAEFWDSDYLAQWGAGAAEVVATAPPDVEPPYQVQELEPDKSEPGVWTQQWEVVAPTLEAAQAYALGRLNRDFDASLPPVDYDGKTWRPGHSSAAVIRDAAEMAELLGLTEVTLTDIDNIEHVYTLANARLVGASIGVAYQQAFLARAAKRRAIADAETPAEALAVTWDDPS